MCHFHSVIVDGAGRIYHQPSNSHEAIRHAYYLPVGLDAKWWECEWDGKRGGAVPIGPLLVQSRGKMSKPTSLAYDAAYRHYEKLAKIVAGELDPHNIAPFNEPEYRDVQEVWEEAQAMKKIEPLAELLNEFDESTQIKMIRELAKEIGVCMDDVAAKEIESAMEDCHDECYSSDTVNEMVEEAEQAVRDEMAEKIEEAVEEATEEGSEKYVEIWQAGFNACQTGSKPQSEYINGLPAFLFDKE